MKNFIPIDDTIEKSSAVTDFLDSLDTDISSPVQADVTQDENVETPELPTENLEEKNAEVTALVVTKPNSLYVAQTMFKKSIKISIKSFLISLSLGFLNLFL